MGSSTRASTPRPCALRRVPRSSRGATTTRSAWAASPRSPRRRPGYSSVRPKNMAPLAETLKLNGYSTAQFGKCHEVPVWETSPMGPFDALADRQRLRALLWLHRRRDEPVRPRGVPRHGAGRAGDDPRRGLPLHRGHDRSHDRVDPAAEGAHARQAVLRVLRAGRDACPAPRAARVVRQVQGHVRRRLGRAARADVRAPEGDRRDPRQRRADCPAGGDPCLG